MTHFYKDKTILITGGTGSLGRAITELLVNGDKQFTPKEVRIYSRDLSKQVELSRLSSAISYTTADIRDTKKLEQAMEGVDFVIHTAALKDVAICEKNPVEATSINVLGTSAVIEAAQKMGVKRLLFTSTDKAVNPAGAMGISKAMAERVVMAKADEYSGLLGDSRRGTPVLSVVRFGNLAGSAGTVIPIFIKQAKDGKQITVTDPKMTRFLMTPRSAAEYTLFALENANNGDIIIQKTPSVSLYNIAKCTTELYSKASEEPIIKIIGARPGEKLFETMASLNEMIKSIPEGDHYLRIPLKATVSEQPNITCDEYNSLNASPITDQELKSIIVSIADSLNI